MLGTLPSYNSRGVLRLLLWLEAPRTTAVLDQMRAAEHDLDTFWSAFDATVDLGTNAEMPRIFEELQGQLALMHSLSAPSTIDVEKHPLPSAAFAKLSLSVPSVPLDDETIEPSHQGQKSEKTKTRGIAAQPEPPENLEMAP